MPPTLFHPASILLSSNIRLRVLAPPHTTLKRPDITMAIISGELITEPTEPTEALKPPSPLSLILNPDKPEPDEPELLTPSDSECSDAFTLTPVLPQDRSKTTHKTN